MFSVNLSKHKIAFPEVLFWDFCERINVIEVVFRYSSVSMSPMAVSVIVYKCLRKGFIRK